MSAWTKISDELPQSGRTVLAFYRNEHGMPRIVRAAWVLANTEEAGSDNDDFSVYNEADDTFYWPEGWYEQIDNLDDYSSAKIYQGEPSHWMPLPQPPDGV